MLMDFHENLYNFYNRDSSDEAINNLLYLEDLLHYPLLPALNLHTHIHTYIHTCMYVNMSENYLFVPNAVLKSMCMLYLSHSLCYIDSLCDWHMNIKRSNEVCVVYWRLLRQYALNCNRLHRLRITVLSIGNEEKHKIIIILLSIFLIWCLFTIVTTIATNEKQSNTVSSYK